MARPTPDHVLAHGRRVAARLARAAVTRGLPPRLTGYRALPRISALDLEQVEVVHPATRVSNPLPRNVADRNDLPDDAGWWGYSMRDVPERHSDPTAIVSVGRATIVGYRAGNSGNYVPAVVASGGRTVEARELRFRPGHARAMRASAEATTQHLDRATWILERVYHNHSHWLTAHLPKLLLLRERGELDDVVLPDELSPAILDSIRRVGIDPDRFGRVDLDRRIDVDDLRLVVTDRFRPELARLTRRALTSASDGPCGRAIFISRRQAPSRRLVDEAELLERLRPLGVEAVVMEELSFDEQVDLMNDASLIVGPHGAGLTNMVACHPGTGVVEIADPSFPNPNFYALASALDHRYSIVAARSVGDGPPLFRDLVVDTSAAVDTVAGALARTEAS